MDVRAFISSAVSQIKDAVHSKLIQFIIFVQPILYGSLMYLMFKNSGRDNFVAYVILGTGMINLWSTIVYSSAGTIDRERRIGTLEILSAMPVSFGNIIGGKVTGSVLLGLTSTFNGYIFIMIISGEKMSISHSLLFVLNLLLIILSFVAISLILAGLFALSRQVRMLTNASEYPVFILSGLIFPVENLPVFTRPLSYILSPTWGAKTLRMCVFGIEDKALFQRELLILAVITITYFVIAKIMFGLLMKKIRYEGSLGVA